jgi:hypothetical protein
MHRRHLTVEQKRDVIAALLKANPTKSDRTIAKQAMTHHHAVAKVRLEEEGRGNISHVEKRTDSKGRKQPAKRQKAAKVADERKSEPPSEPGLHTESEIIAGIERLASRLIGADPESARELYNLLGDRAQVRHLRRTLGSGLRIDEDASDGELAPSAPVAPDDGLDIPDYLRRAPKDAALS